MQSSGSAILLSPTKTHACQYMEVKVNNIIDSVTPTQLTTRHLSKFADPLLAIVAPHQNRGCGMNGVYFYRLLTETEQSRQVAEQSRHVGK